MRAARSSGLHRLVLTCSRELRRGQVFVLQLLLPKRIRRASIVIVAVELSPSPVILLLLAWVRIADGVTNRRGRFLKHEEVRTKAFEVVAHRPHQGDVEVEETVTRAVQEVILHGIDHASDEAPAIVEVVFISDANTRRVKGGSALVL